MTNAKWIPLTEYSNKYQVSISTLRRRIRSHRVEYFYEDGKYLLKDSPLTDHQTNKQREGRDDSDRLESSYVKTPISNSLGIAQEILQPPSAQPVSPPPQKMKPVEAHMEYTLNHSKTDSTHFTYLNEIKKAYALILQEKEEQVLILKDEVADLQTLVKVLESENQRLRLEMKSLKMANSNTESKGNPTLEAVESLFDSEWASDLELE